MERNLDFDTVVDRRNTRSLKYDHAVVRNKPADILPLWVADMDFKTSSYVEDAIVERTRHAIFGYSDPVPGDGYFASHRRWLLEHHHFEVREDWLVRTPGVVTALALAVKAYTEPGEAVLIQQPVYYPFSEVISDNGRRIVSNDLIPEEDGRYHIDFDDFEEKIRQEKIRLFLLCSPHNPVGRVWTKEELTRIGEICIKHGVIVVSDEIHEDFIWKGEHTPFASICDDFAKISLTCTSASKTFNLASMLLSNIYIPDPELRMLFRRQLDAAGISQLGVLGLTAYETAWTHGAVWYEAVCDYIKENIRFLREETAKRLPGVKMTEPEGTYLIWLDFRGTGIEAAELDRRIVHEAKLWLDSGRIFGVSGRGFQRINAACPRSILAEAIDRMAGVIA